MEIIRNKVIDIRKHLDNPIRELFDKYEFKDDIYGIRKEKWDLLEELQILKENNHEVKKKKI